MVSLLTFGLMVLIAFFSFFFLNVFLDQGGYFPYLCGGVLLLDCFTLMGLWKKHTFLDLCMVIGRQLLEGTRVSISDR